MKGLTRNNLYSLSSNLLMSFGITTFLLFIPIIVGNPMSLMTILSIQSFMFIGNIGTALTVDANSKWDNFEVTMPIKRKDVIKARYITSLFMTLCGVFMSSLTVILAINFFEALSVDFIILGLTFGTSLSLITSSLMYPIMLKIGTDKNELIIIMCAGIAVALFVFLLYVLVPILPPSLVNIGSSIVGITLTVLGILLFICSYFFSVSIYTKKEL